MTLKAAVSIALVAMLFASAALAHHNMTALFDFNDRVSLTGTLTKLDWRNPHTYITVDVNGADGVTTSWQIEGPPPSFFRIRDISKGDFEASIGKTVTAELSRSRDHSKSGLLRYLKLPDGKFVSACPQNC